jgi:hypothetical protein
MHPKLKPRKYSVNVELTRKLEIEAMQPASSKEFMEKEKRFNKVIEYEK